MTDQCLQDPFSLFKKYVAVKAHFTSEFLYHNYGGNIRITTKAFHKRKDRVLFEYLAKTLAKNETVPYFVAQIVYSNNMYIADLLESVEKSNRIYDEWLDRMKNIRTNFKRDLQVIKSESSKREMFKVEDTDDHPFMFKLYIRRIITPESYCLLNDAIGQLDMDHHDGLVTTNNFKMKKYRYFLKIDSTEVKEMMRLT